ncbi:uncharacterized protein TNCV_155981 [Trichonephila clavipes]|nr:uncharacterized protein TNCV_155981 [Trichonephila clavipes]
MGQSKSTLPVVWLGRVNRYPYPRIICIKYRNLNQVTRAEIYFFVKKGKFCRQEQRGIVGHCTGFVEVVFSSFSHEELSEILRWLEQIDLSRKVDIDILMQIWKSRVKQIDFVLKWLNRVGSEVRPTKGFLVSITDQKTPGFSSPLPKTTSPRLFRDLSFSFVLPFLSSFPAF